MIVLKNPIVIPGTSLLATENNNVVKAAEMAFDGSIISCQLIYGNLTGTVFTPSAILPLHTVDLVVATGILAVDNTNEQQIPLTAVVPYANAFKAIETLFETWLTAKSLIQGTVSA